MAESWLQQGEETLGNWSVFLGDPTPSSAKITGKIFVTNRGVHFLASLSLAENAASLISEAYFHRPHLSPFEKLDNHAVFPFDAIVDVALVKRSFFQKALALGLRSGERLEFWFGMMSPQKATDLIKSRL